MDTGEECSVSTPVSEPSGVGSDQQTVVSDVGAISIQPMPPVVPPVFPPTIFPNIAPIPTVFPSVFPPTIVPNMAPIPCVVPPVIPPPIVPNVAPIPTFPRHLAPIPVIPPVLRSSMAQNGEVRVSDSDLDQDEAGSSQTASGPAGEYEISEESRQARGRQEEARQEFLMQQPAMALAVPTNDNAVRDLLSRLGEPVTLFGEREMERQDRLRMLMAELDSEGQL